MSADVILSHLHAVKKNATTVESAVVITVNSNATSNPQASLSAGTCEYFPGVDNLTTFYLKSQDNCMTRPSLLYTKLLKLCQQQ